MPHVPAGILKPINTNRDQFNQNLRAGQLAVQQQNANTATDRTPIFQQNADTQRMQAVSQRVRVLVKNRDLKNAEKLLTETSKSGAKFTVRGEEKILERENADGSKDFFSYDEGDLPNTLEIIPDLREEAPQGFGNLDITNDKAELTIEKQRLVASGKAPDSPEVKRIDEVIAAINEGKPSITQAGITGFIATGERGNLPEYMTRAHAIEWDRLTREGKVEQAEAMGTAQGGARYKAEQEQKLSTQGAQLDTFTSGVDEAQAKIAEDTAILGLPGAIARAFTSIKATAAGMSQLTFGEELPFLENIQAYTSSFVETGIKAEVLRATVFTLAMNLAAAEGFVNRAVTEHKIKVNILRLGNILKVKSPEAAHRMLEEIKRTTIEGYNRMVNALNEGPKLREFKETPFEPKEAVPGEETAPGTPTSAEAAADKYLLESR